MTSHYESELVQYGYLLPGKWNHNLFLSPPYQDTLRDELESKLNEARDKATQEVCRPLI